MDIFSPAPTQAETIPFTVINPRGLRAYVRNETFFLAIPKILGVLPTTRFVCPAMAGAPQPAAWVARLGLANQVALLPRQNPQEMAALFRKAQVVTSITTHDGTPNSLLEALACGCFPIAGDIPSLREWINPGVNGLLIDPTDSTALAQAIIDALGDPALRARAAVHNLELIKTRADYRGVMAQAEAFYNQLW